MVVRLETFDDLYDATIWMENLLEMYYFNNIRDGVNGEISLINGRWRVSVIDDEGQLELPLKFS